MALITLYCNRSNIVGKIEASNGITTHVRSKITRAPLQFFGFCYILSSGIWDLAHSVVDYLVLRDTSHFLLCLLKMVNYCTYFLCIYVGTQLFKNIYVKMNTFTMLAQNSVSLVSTKLNTFVAIPIHSISLSRY